MKQALMDIMVAMMPAMKPMVWLGISMMFIGFVALVLRITLGKTSLLKTTLKWTGGILLGLGSFFVIAQFMGMWLGASPKINFGDPAKFEFILYQFWQIGLVGLAGGIVYWLTQKKM